MQNKNICVLYSLLVFSSCFIQGFSLPQQRFSGREFARKFGNDADLDGGFSDNSIVQDIQPSAKQDEGLLQTVIQVAMKFMPLIIDAISGNSGPSQTDRIEGIDLKEDEGGLSVKNIAMLGLKLFLAVAGSGSSGIEKSDFPFEAPLLSVMETLIGAVLGGAQDRSENQQMAKQAVEVVKLIINLVEALTTSISSEQRSFY